MKYPTGAIYKGEWKDDKREGNGIITYESETKFEGIWINNRRNGFGKQICINGEEYEGNWTDSYRNGNGTMKYANGDIFKGEWEKSERHERGLYILKDGRKVAGNWINDDLQPVVKIEYPHGNRYEGKIKDESFQKHGKGTLFFNNGGQFNGCWDNDTEIGKGKYTLECSDRTYEEFWEGGRVCDSVLTIADGTKYEAIWKEVKKEKPTKGTKKKQNCK